ncbi:putative lipoprotein [Enhygromyxa salina]|uniref:Putative lipoprotein n=1 Tax=Enhygromyxa salina TaxID=215803 RepID=A0A0C2CSD3_9BACT|nr:ferritin-like domain-containing protein [Enhygromyxa salina]KIG14091.1 putative lipoprotein [Enhygromyxa salina]
MKTKLDPAYLSIIAALGLELACVSRTSGTDMGEENGTDGNVDTADSADSSDSASTSTSTTTGDGDGDGDSGDGDGDETGPPPDPFECTNPTPITQANSELPSGFVECEGGFIHRVEAVECVGPQGPDAPACADSMSGCQTAADCLEQPHGSCALDIWGSCGCHYGCASDADCDPGSVCACAGVIGEASQCIPAGCITTDDCNDGLCGLSLDPGICDDSYSLACASPTDECHVNADCPDAPCPSFPEGEPTQFYCSASGAPGFSCEPPGWCEGDCGRPFLISGHARVASTTQREDWCAAISPNPLDAQTRQQLAQYWTQVGQFEHASVASFARFATQLLELGAPPHLLAETHRAMTDEIEHARLAFGLASAYAGASVGPGPLDIRGCVTAPSTHAIIEALVLEACVGETLAAIEAREAAAHATDRQVAATLAQIAQDELRHAQLGWRALRWMLDTAEPSLVEFAFARLDQAMQEATVTTAAAGVPASLRIHGVLDDNLRTRLRREGVANLIQPCVAALRSAFGLGEAASSSGEAAFS